ncbi:MULTISPECIES: carbonate dehydratase [Providencia]|uniref:carbonate dehydratase n=1 Tax=Providencia TaxID=586 RepID=UPI0021D48F0D|nr:MULTISPECIES: carbonate dehydratase [Providencia]WIE07545.1 carbonate dehydratase [Providencia rettgeri]
MLRKNPSGHSPVISEKAYIDPTAIICGKVIVEDYVYIGPYAVIRADELNEEGDMSPIVIGSHTSIAHRAIVHGPCNIATRVFIGFNSVLFNCKIGENCVVRYNAVVDGLTLPPALYIPSCVHVNAHSDLSQFKQVDRASLQFSEEVAATNVQLVEGYRRLRNEF